MSNFYQDRILIFLEKISILKILIFSWNLCCFFQKRSWPAIGRPTREKIKLKCWQTIDRPMAGHMATGEKKLFWKKNWKIKKFCRKIIFCSWNFFWQKLEIILHILTIYFISNMFIAVGMDTYIWRFDNLKKGCKKKRLKSVFFIL